jgi:Domain of unknown function (DUF4783)
MTSTSLKPLLFTAFFCFILNIATPAQGFENIVNGFKNGDAAEVAKNFEGNVEITIKTGTTSYSKRQAEMVLKSFFAAHKPKTFTIAHEGTSPQGSKYFIASLTSANGNYRTYVYAKTVKTELVIQEIRFEEQ